VGDGRGPWAEPAGHSSGARRRARVGGIARTPAHEARVGRFGRRVRLANLVDGADWAPEAAHRPRKPMSVTVPPGLSMPIRKDEDHGRPWFWTLGARLRSRGRRHRPVCGPEIRRRFSMPGNEGPFGSEKAAVFFFSAMSPAGRFCTDRYSCACGSTQCLLACRTGEKAGTAGPRILKGSLYGQCNRRGGWALGTGSSVPRN